MPLARCKEVCMPPERCADGARGARHPRVVYSNLFFACHRLFHSCMPNRPVLVQRIIVVQLCRHYGAYFEERALSQSERCTFSKNLHFSSPQLTATFFLYKGKCTGASTSHIFAEQALRHWVGRGVHVVLNANLPSPEVEPHPIFSKRILY